MSGQSTTRQAANVTVAGRAQRYGSYKGGYQIINQSLNAIVWCADNPSVADGFGTPVNPGTSIVWATDGELFMCLGTDAQSVAAGSCDVILSYDVQNWQPNPIAIAAAILNSGVIIVDQPLVLNNTVIAVGGTRGPYDVSRYNSVFFTFINNTANAGYVDILWYNDAALTQLMGVDHINYDGSLFPNAYWFGQIPCRGAYLVVIANHTSVAAVITASNRQCDGIQNQVPYSVGGDYALARSVQTLGASAGGTAFSTPPWYGEVDIISLSYLAGVATNVTTFVSGISVQYPFPPEADLVMSTADARATQVTLTGINGIVYSTRVERVAMSGGQLTLISYNPTALVGVSSVVCVVPVPKSKA